MAKPKEPNFIRVDANPILQALEDIESWAGEAYMTPCKECPTGDEVYLAIQDIKIAMEEGERC